jgi:hypothetical protein
MIRVALKLIVTLILGILAEPLAAAAPPGAKVTTIGIFR